MAQSAAFQWHADARLFTADAQIARDVCAASSGFTTIPADPAAETLSALAAAIKGGDGFCITDTPLPENIHIAPGYFVTLTGGSSGRPKFVHRTHASWIESFAVNARLFSLTPNDRVAVFGRLTHSLALYGVLEGLHLGLDTYALGDTRPKTQRASVARNDITVLYATPTQLRMLARGAGTLPNVRLILCGGGALDPATRAAILVLCPNAAVHVFYGASETSFITLADPSTPDGAVGRPYPGVDLRILDPDGLPTSQTGEVWVQSPYLFENYATDAPTDTRWRDGFITVGEMGQLDRNGNLWLAGRKNRMVTIADQNVFPDVIEAFLAGHPQFNPCAIVSLPDQTRGHRLIAVLEGAHDGITARALKEKCAAKFNALMTPARVLFHPCIPVLASGKIDLITLTRWVEDHV